MGGPSGKCHGLCDRCFIILLLVGSILRGSCVPHVLGAGACVSVHVEVDHLQGRGACQESWKTTSQVTGILILVLHWPSHWPLQVFFIFHMAAPPNQISCSATG